MRLKDAVFVLAMAMLAGCGGGKSDDSAASGEPAKNGTKKQAPQPPGSGGQTVREPAKAGVGKRGRDYGRGPIATPISVLFLTQQRVVFELQIAPAMNLYKAEHDHFPRTHEEFMEEIINKNSIKLPELPEGQQYVYDPEKAARMSSYDPKDPPLMVERPR